MKKKLLFLTFLFLSCLTSTVYATKINIDTDNKEIQQGETIILKIGIKDIDVNNEVNAIQGKLIYDKEIFEKVQSQDISSINNWNIAYNDENTESEGKFIIINLSTTKENQDILEVKLKAKENAKVTNTSVEIQELCMVHDNDMIQMENCEIEMKVKRKFSIKDRFLKWIQKIFMKS